MISTLCPAGLILLFSAVSGAVLLEEPLNSIRVGFGGANDPLVLTPETLPNKSDYKYTRLTRSSGPFTAHLVEAVNAGASKRAVYNATDKNWPHDIPYVIHKTFTGDVAAFRLALRFISSRVCVTFHDVTNTYDQNDPTWFAKNNYTSNSYVQISGGSGCFGSYGQGPGYGIQVVYPCNGFGINLHEMLHTLGVAHTQEGSIRDSYLSVNEEDIKSSLLYSYRKIKDPNLVNDYFDSDSIMMYGDSTWNKDGLETFTPLRDDMFHLGTQFSDENVVFFELSRVYRCNERFCNNDQTDCGPGYHTLVKGTCRCVCPDELDPAANCKSQINGPTSNLTWPNTPMVFYGDTKCPTGFDPTPGWLPLTATYTPRQAPVPVTYPIAGHTLSVPLCTKSTPLDPGDVDWWSWPLGGQFCFVKPVGVECGGPFENGALEFQTSSAVHPNGSIGDITINNTTVHAKFCCKNKEAVALTTDLPNGEPFRLIPTYHICPVVRGMRSTYSPFTFWTVSSKSIGPVPPLSYFYPNGFYHYQCYYQPPTYGCNEVFNLTSTNRSVTVLTPGFHAAREPNRRCFYGFNVPENARLRLTINELHLHDNDQFLVKKYHKWQNPYQVDNANPPYQLVSETDYLSLQFWASWEATTRKGVNFTVDLIPAEDECYAIDKKGADYFGNKSISETYEDCIPWAKATTCDDFPFDGLNGITLLESGNSCRNPNGALIQPWCYVFVRGSVCHRRYCDVCNIKSPVDMIKNCAALKSTIPDFCNTAVERFGCFKTCGFPAQYHSPANCSAPSLPPDVIVNGGLRTLYAEGEVINITCSSSGALINEIRCTSDGWSGQAFGCNGCPENWIPYGDRCFNYSVSGLTRREAAAICRSHDPTGTLFEVRSLADQQMIRKFKSSLGANYGHDNWISGELESEYGQWIMDSGDTMTYFNWSTTAETTRMSFNCIQLIAEYEADYNQGGWTTLPCDGKHVAPYVCQVDNSVSSVCNDRVRTCADVIAAFPGFCRVGRSSASAVRYCRKSCGRCQVSNGGAKCSDLGSSTLTRTSSQVTVSVGQVMTFTCKPNLYHVGGDLTRACSYRGHLLGAEPVCQAAPVAVDIKVDMLRRRRETLPERLAILLDHDGYRIPFAGKITKWYYFCEKSGTLDLLVYRHSGGSYQYVGSNSVLCEPGWIRTHNVPVPQQIHVVKDDVFGAYSLNRTTLSISDCDDAAEKTFLLPAMNATTLSELTSTTGHVFTGHRCAVPSLAVRVEP
ncbi:unnamed protein product [Lymnaea stagnalis]|uniref:Metalloendopeptidase n=1 Tax=Lymnaea stagnalis TaxID=6523 RepID=A0AAV2IK04_LYMST